MRRKVTSKSSYELHNSTALHIPHLLRAIYIHTVYILAHYVCITVSCVTHQTFSGVFQPNVISNETTAGCVRTESNKNGESFR
jgi:hypothetical protein